MALLQFPIKAELHQLISGIDAIRGNEKQFLEKIADLSVNIEEQKIDYPENAFANLKQIVVISLIPPYFYKDDVKRGNFFIIDDTHFRIGTVTKKGIRKNYYECLCYSVDV